MLTRYNSTEWLVRWTHTGINTGSEFASTLCFPRPKNIHTSILTLSQGLMHARQALSYIPSPYLSFRAEAMFILGTPRTGGIGSGWYCPKWNSSNEWSLVQNFPGDHPRLSQFYTPVFLHNPTFFIFVFFTVITLNKLLSPAQWALLTGFCTYTHRHTHKCMCVYAFFIFFFFW
jgi:hypothetical protein